MTVLKPARAPDIPPLWLQHYAILALDLGQKTGWAVRNADGAIASGTVEFKPGRFEGGGMAFLRSRAWLQEVDETTGGGDTVYFEEVRPTEAWRPRTPTGSRPPDRMGRGQQDPVPRCPGRHHQARDRAG